MTLAIALNYGSQQEIARAAARRRPRGNHAETIAAELDTADLPPLDLLIRTSGEVRLSNFLLWQAAYAEMVFTPCCGPISPPIICARPLASCRAGAAFWRTLSLRRQPRRPSGRTCRCGWLRRWSCWRCGPGGVARRVALDAFIALVAWSSSANMCAWWRASR
jgi:hypothetical protein